jgi:class 3 adenylate cyclase
MADRKNGYPDSAERYGAALFLDLQESTFMWQNYHELAEESLNRLQDCLRLLLRREGCQGEIGNFTGDGFLIIFKNVINAIHLASALIEEWEPVRASLLKKAGRETGEIYILRTGIDFGKYYQWQDQYVGPVINRAQRCEGASKDFLGLLAELNLKPGRNHHYVFVTRAVWNNVSQANFECQGPYEVHFRGVQDQDKIYALWPLPAVTREAQAQDGTRAQARGGEPRPIPAAIQDLGADLNLVKSNPHSNKKKVLAGVMQKSEKLIKKESLSSAELSLVKYYLAEAVLLSGRAATIKDVNWKLIKDSIPLFRDALDASIKAGGDPDGRALIWLSLGEALTLCVHAENQKPKKTEVLKEAEVLIRKALATLPADTPDYARALANLGFILWKQVKDKAPAEAERLDEIKRYLAQAQTIYEKNHLHDDIGVIQDWLRRHG